MRLDPFERFRRNRFLAPVSAGTLEKVGSLAGLSADSSVLDAACGKGEGLLALARAFGCSAVGLDDRPEFVEDARRRALFGDLSHLVDFLAHPGGDLPFDDGYFDLALLRGPAHPSNVIDRLGGLARVVRPGGRIAFSCLAWKPEADGDVPAGRLAEWLDAYLPCEPADPEELWARFVEEGCAVELAEREAQNAWEDFLAPQARVILENRREFADSREARETLDAWQRDLEIYHEGGGKELLGYATFLLRLP